MGHLAVEGQAFSEEVTRALKCDMWTGVSKAQRQEVLRAGSTIHAKVHGEKNYVTSQESRRFWVLEKVHDDTGTERDAQTVVGLLAW